MKTRKAYSTDLTDDEWYRLQWLLPRQRRGKPATHERREMLNAMFYVARTGCTWRLLPHDFPAWEAVYACFRRLNQKGIWQQRNDALRQQVRTEAERAADPSVLIVDSQSVQTAEKRGHVATTRTSGAQAASDKSPSTR
jgi:putative transposase